MSHGWKVAIAPNAVADLSRDAAADVAAAHLWQAGALSVTVGRDGGVDGVFDDRRSLPVPWLQQSATWSPLDDDNPMAAWHATSKPVRAGNFVLVPSHLADEVRAAPGAHRIVLDAGMAFGTGHHETTAGCLEALSGLPVEGMRVVDVGTGTGVLAIAAALLGAAHVVGVDVDPTAVRVATGNARRNGVEVAMATGSTAMLRSAMAETAGDAATNPDLTGPYDVVLANLLTGTLVELAADLHALCAPGGVLVASGTSVGRANAVTRALIRAGFVEVDVHPATQWAVLVARRLDPNDRQSGRRATARNRG